MIQAIRYQIVLSSVKISEYELLTHLQEEICILEENYHLERLEFWVTTISQSVKLTQSDMLRNPPPARERDLNQV